MKLMLLLICALITANCNAASYWVSPTGSDKAKGTATSPWQTLSKAGSSLKAGDILTLSGTFSGTLSLMVPCTVQGPATISAGDGDGVYIYDTSNVKVTNLTITAGTGNTGTGVLAYCDTNEGGLTLSELTVSGFGQNGISIGSWNGSAGWSNVAVSNCTLSGNTLNGLLSYNQSLAANTNWTVTGVTAYSNPGSSGSDPSGSGITLGGVNGCLVDHCTAHDNGAAGNGGVGIWAYSSNAVTIQHCTSYANQTAGTSDGDGFDLDGGTTNSVMQYDYAYKNAGAGFLICQFAGAAPNSGNVVRYNIAQNNGLKNSYPGIYAYSTVGAEVYGNTVYGSGSPFGAVNWNGPQLAVYNNDFLATGPTVAYVSASAMPTFRNNNFYSYAAHWNASINGKGYTSVWDASEIAVNPLLAAVGTGPSGYLQKPGSPLRGAGVNLTTLGINAVSDYYGTAITAPFDIGAQQTGG